MRPAVVVGQTNAYNCLIAFFDGVIWAVDTTFPSINGRLWGVYAVDGSRRDIWVCGGTGVEGWTAPILYHWNGVVWINHSSDISDAVYFHNIDGSDSNNVWVVGTATGAIPNGAWNWNGIAWTPTKTNTVTLNTLITNGGIDITVSAEGNAYVINKTTDEYGLQVKSNKIVSTWDTIFTFGASTGNGASYIKAFTDSSMIASNFGGDGTNRYAAKIYDGTTWSLVGKRSAGIPPHTGSKLIAGIDPAHFFWKDTYSGLLPHRLINPGKETAGEVIGTSKEPRGSQNYNTQYLMLAEDDLWVASLKFFDIYAHNWRNTPELSHWEGGTIWSGPGDYNANGLDALAWYDIASIAMPPSLSNQSPAPGEIDVLPTVNIYFDVTETLNGVELASVEIYVNANLAYDGATDTFQVGFTGSGSARIVVVGGYGFMIDSLARFAAGSLVSIRVVAKDDVAPPQSELDETYTFTIGYPLPYLISSPISPNPGYFLNTHMEWKVGERE